MGALYLVATPIGNLEDITLRAVRVLGEVSLIAAEDTRTARKLLSHLKLHRPITAYFEEHSPKLERVLQALELGDVAVVSEAGMPGLSDPGVELVRAALARGVRVIPLPGANALVPALVASGLPTAQFTFLGFLPRERKARLRLLGSVAAEPRTLVAYESPHRIRESLADLERALGDRPACLARELTKVYEEFLRGPLSVLRKGLEEAEPRGEFTVIVGGNTEPAEAAGAWDDERVCRSLAELFAGGALRTRAVKEVTHLSGRTRAEVYALSLQNDRQGEREQAD